MRRIGIVGAGQSGLQLGIGLLKNGHEAVLLSNQTPEQIANGRVTSSQCMFDAASQHERDLGIAFWDDITPPVEGIEITVVGENSARAFGWSERLDAPAQSVDQRVKMPRWLEEFQRLGGDLRIIDAGIPELEVLSRECELVVVASGKGDVSRLFERDAEKSPFDKPMRALGLTYVTGIVPRPEYSAVCFNLIPGVGEYFVFPALTTTGPCEIMVFEGVPAGPMDVWGDVRSPEQHLETSLNILRQFIPWEFERSRDARLTDPNGILSGRFPPTVRRPVAAMPSGAAILGMADTVCLNDPITGQGSNNASKCAAVYLQSILERGQEPFDPAWMQHTFDKYWTYARAATEWTNGMLLPPPPHIVSLLVAGIEQRRIRRWFVNGFDDPRRFFPAITSPKAAESFILADAA